MKRYRLKIPEMIRREDAKMADKLEGHSVVTSNSFGSDMFIQETQCSCKRDWLEEINDEPMSAEEWAEQNYKNFDCLHDCIDYATRAHKAGAAENEKKHRPTQTFDEWYKRCQCTLDMNDIGYPEARDIWQACKAAHNLPEEN